MALTIHAERSVLLPPGTEPDLTEVRRALGVFLDPGLGVEIQGLPSGRCRILPAADLDAVCATVSDYADESVYWMLNPVDANLQRPRGLGAKIENVKYRRWLLIDIDRSKELDPATAKCSATEEEKEKARLLSVLIYDHFAGLEWPAPVVVDSGNGWHLLYRVDLQNDEISRSTMKAVLNRLGDKFDNPHAEIDRKVFNANRVSKLPGTWARKGPNTPDRPHRPCRLLVVPQEVVPIPFEKLKQFAENEQKPVEAEPSGLKIHAASLGDSSEKRYVQKILDAELSRVALCGAGSRNNQLFQSAAAIGNRIHTGLVSREEAESLLLRAAGDCRLIADDGEHGVRATIRSGLDTGMAKPKDIPALNGVASHSQMGSLAIRPDEPKVKPGEIIIFRGSEVTPKKVEWLWPGRIPIGKLTTFAGLGGLGKTFVLCDITARVTGGLPWPDMHGECCEPGQVLFISGEDEADDTLVPRLIELGADLKKVIFLKTSIQDKFTLADIDILDIAYEQAGGNIRFVAIDPPAAYLGDVNEHKNAEVRSLLTPLASWAARRRTSVTFNTHFNKAGGQNIESMMRVMGSVAWVNAVRCAHVFAADPDDLDRRFFIPNKTNIGVRKKGLAYSIVVTEELARLEWGEEVDITANEAVSNARPSRRVVASDWLIEKFREKRSWFSDDLFRAAKEEGVSRNAVFEAKNTLDLPKAKKETDQAGNSSWAWWVPEDWERLRPEEPDEQEF